MIMMMDCDDDNDANDDDDDDADDADDADDDNWEILTMLKRKFNFGA